MLIAIFPDFGNSNARQSAVGREVVIALRVAFEQRGSFG
jgi:hypothetical protein